MPFHHVVVHYLIHANVILTVIGFAKFLKMFVCFWEAFFESLLSRSNEVFGFLWVMFAHLLRPFNPHSRIFEVIHHFAV